MEMAEQAIGAKVVRSEWLPGRPIPDAVAGVVSALPAAHDGGLAEQAIAQGVPFVSCSEDAAVTNELLGLNDAAFAGRTTVAIGCGLAPGLADVLACHGVAMFDRADEVHIARSGVAGAACQRQLELAVRGRAQQWRDGGWATERAGAESGLVFFPEPVGMRECGHAASGQTRLLMETLPELSRATARLAIGRRPMSPGCLSRWLPVNQQTEDDWSGAWVEVRGWQGLRRDVVVLGVVDKMAVVAGAVLAVTAGALVGAIDDVLKDQPVGAHGLGALVKPAPFLAELARRGVKAATFTGVADVQPR